MASSSTTDEPLSSSSSSDTNVNVLIAAAVLPNPVTLFVPSVFEINNRDANTSTKDSGGGEPRQVQEEKLGWTLTERHGMEIILQVQSSSGVSLEYHDGKGSQDLKIVSTGDSCVVDANFFTIKEVEGQSPGDFGKRRFLEIRVPRGGQSTSLYDCYVIFFRPHQNVEKVTQALDLFRKKHSEKKTTTEKPKETPVPVVVPEVKPKPKPRVVTKVDMGLQVDVNFDPDVYYVAGGRMIAIQTPYDDDYKPLKPTVFKNMPMIVVFATCSDSDESLNSSTDTAVSTLSFPELRSSITSVTSVDAESERNVSSSLRLNVGGDSSTGTPSVPLSPMLRPCTPIETKSCSTQLSAGALIEEEIQIGPKEEEEVSTKSVPEELPPSTPTKHTFAEKAKNGIFKQNQAQAKSVSSYLNKVGVGGGTTSTASAAAAAASSKAASNTTSGSSKSVTSGPKPASSSASKGVLSTGGRPPPVTAPPPRPKTTTIPTIPNYRSNIASRYRTAAHTTTTTTTSTLGQSLHPESLLLQTSKSSKDKTNKSSTSSSGSPQMHHHQSQSLLSSSSDSDTMSSSKASSSSIPSTAAAATILEPIKLAAARPTSSPTSSTKTDRQWNPSSSDHKLMKGDENERDNTVLPVAATPLPLPKPKTIGIGTRQVNNNNDLSKIGITRSKSMINPFPTKRLDRRENAANHMKFGGSGSGPMMMMAGGGGKRNILSGNGNNKLASASCFRKLHSNSYISLPDETLCQRRGPQVDDDGWETVKARSNRSKWSSSNSSIGSNANQSRTSLDKGHTTTPQSLGKEAPVMMSHKKTSTMSVMNISEMISSAEDEECATQTFAKGVQTTTMMMDTNNKKRKGSEIGSGDAGKESLENESGNDDEEIKRKDADLDDVMREEDLIEEELRQVEKDFERIENDSTTEDGTITDSDHAPSPELIDTEELDDQFFFVSMNADGGKGDEGTNHRESGRILSLREKLMSPAKNRDGAETLKKYKAKLAKAERNREKLLQSKFNRYVELSDKFESLAETRKNLVVERAELIQKAEERRRRAAEKRKKHIKSIQRKAHDEESKAKEIAFINLLEAQNKRHDYFASAQEIEERLQTIQEERRIKLEERAGKASNVIIRQSGIKKDWQAKLISLQEKRRKTEERIAREREEKDKERSEKAQKKARDREVRLSALNAAKQAEKEELQKKIKQKLEDTARRHEENMEQIRQKAIDLGTPRSISEDNSTPSSYRVCTLCNVIINSGIHEIQHIRSRTHLDRIKKQEKTNDDHLGDPTSSEGLGIKFITDIQADKIDPKIHTDRNRFKGLKKHSKKLMQKLMDSGHEFEKSVREDKTEKSMGGGDYNLWTKVRKSIADLERILALFNSNKGSSNHLTALDRAIMEIRKITVNNIPIKNAIVSMNGLDVLLKVATCQAQDLPIKTKVNAVVTIHGFIHGSLSNALHILRGTGICTLMNLCTDRWKTLIPNDDRWLCKSPQGPADSVPTDLFLQTTFQLIFSVLEYVPSPFNGIPSKGAYLTQEDVHSIKTRMFDVIGYLVSSGVVDRISVYCGRVRGPVDNQPDVATLLEVFLDFLVVLIYTLQFCWGQDPTGCIIHKKEPDGTQLLAALEASEVAGAVSLSYSLLFYQGAPMRPRDLAGQENAKSSPPPLGDRTADVVRSALGLINAVARLDLLILQNVLVSEAVSLQFRHIAGQLLWQVVPCRHTNPRMKTLLNQVIIAIGNFAVGNKHNQSTIQSGQTPTVLQLLCTVPQEFFTDQKWKHNFLPTLLAATNGCPPNQEVLLQNNVDQRVLEDYLNSEDGKKNVIIRRMLSIASSPQEDKDNARPIAAKKSSSAKGNKPKPLEENNSLPD